MKKIAFVLTILGGTAFSESSAQMVNNGQLIHVEDNGLLFIDGNFEHRDGAISGKGTIELKGDWNNSSSGSAFNGSAQGTVHFTGASQYISGSKTAFPNLTLEGTGDKTLETDTEIYGSLLLNDRNLHLRRYTLSVLNPQSGAIQRTSGFITTDDGGHLIRNTNSSAAYLFPLGSTLNNPAFAGMSFLYRPVSLEPENANQNSYSANLNNTDPNPQFSRNSFGSGLKDISNKYYYLLSHPSGLSKFKAQFYQNTSVEDNSAIVDWNTTLSLWEKLSTHVQDGLSADGFNRTLSYTFNAGINNLPVTFAGISSINSPLKFYNAFSPDGDGRNDRWLIPDIDKYPDNNLSIFNRWGDEVFKATGYSSSNAWDGSNLQSGTYFYVLTVNVGGEKKTYKGFITMIKGN